MWIDERIAPITFKRDYKLRKEVEILLLDELVVMSNRTSILHSKQVSHFVVERKQTLT